jgi:thermitase
MAPRKSLAWGLGLSLLGITGLSQAQLSPPAATHRPVMNPAALHAPRFAPDRVLVKFKPGTAKSAIGEAHRLAGAHARGTLSRLGVRVVEVPAGTVLEKVAAYKRNPNVLYAEPDYYRVLVMPTEEPGPTPAGHADYFLEQWYLHNTGQSHAFVEQTILGPVLSITQGTPDADIDAPEAWELSQGVATTDPTAANTPKVAVLDSGADCDALELQGKCLEQTNLVGLDPGDFGLDPCPADAPACDNFGHGTFVASEVGANTNNSEGIAGAGWNTSLGIFKVCYQEIVSDGVNVFLVGLCPLSASAEAITLAASDQFDAANHLTRSQYHVITMSYGSDLVDPVTGEVMPSAPPNTECDAVLYAWNRGVVVVAGAGNNGDTNKFYPAACTDDPETGTGQSTVIAVAASDHDDNRASFSTYSTDADDWVSVAAPGEAIVGVLPDAQCELPSGVDTCVNWLDGTSMATPLVAGGAALVWSDLYQSGTVDGALAPSACTVGGTPCNQVVRARIEAGADKVGAQGQDLLQWTRNGRLNLANALVGGTPPPPGTPRVSARASVPSAAEAGLVTGRFTVQRTESTDEALVVHVTITGTATPGTDYVPLPNTVTIPAGAASADVDVVPLDDALVESNETVTMTVAPDPAYVPGAPSSATVVISSDDLPPDFVVSSLTVPTKAGIGAAISVSDTTKNQGGGPSAASVTRFYVSTNSAFDAGDIFLGSRDVAGLAPGASSSGTTLLTIPPGTPTGTLYLIARADGADAFVETSEANNTAARALRIGPDLTVSSLTAPTVAAPGSTIALGDTTTNGGGGGAPASTTTFSLSPNATLDASDVVLGSRAVPALGAGESSSGTVAVTLPTGLAPGTWYVIAQADGTGVVPETLETNNTRASAVAVGADLVIASMTVPTTAGAGQPITVNDTTRNQGGGAAPTSTTAFYLSTNNVLDAGDTPLGSRSVPALDPGGSSAASTMLTIPAGTAGSYYLIAQTDAGGAIAETNETNNTTARAIQVGADLVVSSFTVPTVAAAGAAIAVTDTTKNQGGGGAGGTTTAFYLSANSSFDAGDAPLGSRSVPPLGAGATSTATTNLTLPAGLATGTWYVLARADAGNAELETQETNNVAARAVQIGPDLTVTPFTVPGTAAAGGTITVSDTTKNIGSSPAAPSTTSFYLSANNVLDASDTLLGTRAVPLLAAGATSVASTPLAIPAGTAAGGWFVIARVDAADAIVETQEGNNTSARLVQVGPDLTVAFLTGPTTAAPGATITVNDTTRNQGGDVAGESTTTLYLSANSTLDASDTLLGSRLVPPLAPGAMQAGSTAVVIPVGTAPGSWFLIAVADGGGGVAEPIETNNWRSRAIDVVQ